MSIEQLKKKLESERVYLNSLTMTQGGPEHTFVNRFDKGFESATNRLLPLLEKAIEVAEFYSAEENLVGSITGPNGPWDYSKVDLDRGKKAREFLSDFIKMTEIKKEFGE